MSEQSFGGFGGQAIYYGLLDDVGHRYPGKNPVDHDSVAHHLVTSAIYNKSILINDGYLIANPMIVDDLSNSSESLIGCLLRSKSAFIFTRGSGRNLIEGIEEISQYVDRHREIRRDEKNWELMKDDLREITRFTKGEMLSWPKDKNTSHIFHTLLCSAVKEITENQCSLFSQQFLTDLEGIFRLYDDNKLEYYRAARTVWENACIQYYINIIKENPSKYAEFQDIEVKDFYKTNQISYTLTNQSTEEQKAARFPYYNQIRQFMNIANIVYHNAYAAAAQLSIDQIELEDHELLSCRAGVATSLEARFTGLVRAYEEPNITESLSRERIGQLCQLLISVPKTIEFLEDYTFLMHLSGNRDTRTARRQYLHEIEKFIVGEENFKIALEARKEYVRHIARIMLRSTKSTTFERVSELITDLVLDLISSPLSFGASTALKAVPLIFDKFRADHSERLISNVSAPLKRGRIESQLTSDGLGAVQDGTEVEFLQNMGFYHGPIDRAGADRLLRDIDPNPEG